MNQKNKNIGIISLFGLSFIYIIIRAFSIPLVHDEAATFFHYIHPGSFLPPYAHWDANNHILNSALSYLSYLVFGSSELALRLPNLLFFPLFFIYTYKISQEFKNRILGYSFFLTLIFAHNFIEYFALTRGYGMSMALLMASVYYTIQTLKYQKLQSYFFSSLFMSLAITANLTLMNTAIMTFGILVINILYNYQNTKISTSIKSVGISTFFGLIPIILLSLLLLEFKDRGALYYGTLDGFWDLTITSLIKLLSGSENTIIGVFVIIYFCLIISLSIYKFIKSPKIQTLWNKHMLFFYFLLGNMVAVFILALVLKVNYPEDRTGLYFFPFFIGSLLFLVDSVSHQISRKLIIFILLPLLFFPIHFLLHINFSHSSFWKNERIPYRFTEQIIKDSRENNILYTIGGYHIRTLCFAYQNLRTGGALNQIQTRQYPEAESDYQIVNLNDDNIWENTYESIDYDPISRLSLLKRINKFEKVPIYKENKPEEIVTLTPFYGLYKAEIDSLIGNTLLIELDFYLETLQEPFIGNIVAQVNDSNNKTLRYEFINLSWKKTKWNNEQSHFNGSILINNIPPEAASLKVYLWNIKKKEFSIKNSKIIINKFEQ